MNNNNILSYVEPIGTDYTVTIPSKNGPISMPINVAPKYQNQNQTQPIAKCIMLGFIIILVIVILYRVVLCNLNKRPIDRDECDNRRDYYVNEPIDGLTRCGWVFYAAEWCGYCTKQKEVLEQYYPNFLKVPGNVLYDQPNINAYPTWINKNTKQVVSGFQTKESLDNMAMC